MEKVVKLKKLSGKTVENEKMAGKKQNGKNGRKNR